MRTYALHADIVPLYGGRTRHMSGNWTSAHGATDRCGCVLAGTRPEGSRADRDEVIKGNEFFLGELRRIEKGAHRRLAIALPSLMPPFIVVLVERRIKVCLQGGDPIRRSSFFGSDVVALAGAWSCVVALRSWWIVEALLLFWYPNRYRSDSFRSTHIAPIFLRFPGPSQRLV